MSQPIVLLLDDSQLGYQLASQIRQVGYEPLYATNETQLAQAMIQAPVLCLVDLTAQTLKWERLVRFVKGPTKKNNHVPIIGFESENDQSLQARALTAGCTIVVNRTEIDTNLPHLIEKNIWRIDPEICNQPLPVLALKGIEEFNQGLFFECHETLEDAWNEETGLVRLLYQGILQVAVGYLHITRKNWRGAVKVLERGIPKAAHFRPICQGVDVADMVAQAQIIRAKLIDLGPDGIEDFDTSTFPKVKVNNAYLEIGKNV